MKKYRDYSKFNQRSNWATFTDHNLHFPWYSCWLSAKQRCLNKNNSGYKYYGAKGIKCLITLEELKEIWFRDKAWKMDRPSIDRIDSNGHYVLENCRFIELSENIARANRKNSITVHNSWKVYTRV